MRSSGWIFGLLLMILACGLSFGAGYFIAKQDVPPPAPQIETAELPPARTQAERDKVVLPLTNQPSTDQPEDSGNLKPGPRTEPATGQPGTKPDQPPVEAGTKPESIKPAGDARTAAEAAEAIKELEKKLKELEGRDAFDPEAMLNGPKVDFAATITGSVSDTAGQPVAGAGIYGEFSENYGGGGNVLRVSIAGDGQDVGDLLTTTDSGGTFRIDINRKVNQRAGLHVDLTAKLQGYADSKTIGVTLKNGDTKEGIKLALRQAGSVAGRVVDQSGAGIAGMQVSLSSGSQMGDLGLEIEMGGAGSKLSATTDASGEYRIENVPEGDYRLKLRGAGYREVSGPAQIKVKAGAETRAAADFVVTITCSVRLAVQDAAGQPLRAWVTLHFKDAEGKSVKKLNGMTDADGNFSANEPPVGNFNVEVTAWGYKPETVPANVMEGLACDLGRLTLQPSESKPGTGESDE